MIKLAFLLTSLLFAGQPEQAAPSTVEPDAVTQADEAQAKTPQEGSGASGSPLRTAEQIEDDKKIVCRRVAIVGSRFKKRVCASKEEWRTRRDSSVQETATLQRRARGFEPSGEPGF